MNVGLQAMNQKMCPFNLCKCVQGEEDNGKIIHNLQISDLKNNLFEIMKPNAIKKMSILLHQCATLLYFTNTKKYFYQNIIYI